MESLQCFRFRGVRVVGKDQARLLPEPEVHGPSMGLGSVPHLKKQKAGVVHCCWAIATFRLGVTFLRLVQRLYVLSLLFCLSVVNRAL